MGLIKEGDDFAVLSDILGDEDHLGDMDFKVAGTANGITALQMDIKITGITAGDHEDGARPGAATAACTSSARWPRRCRRPRDELGEHAPRIETMQIPTDKIRDVIGPGGKVIREIVEETGAKIDIDDDGIGQDRLGQRRGDRAGRSTWIKSHRRRARGRQDLQGQGREDRRLRRLRELLRHQATAWCTSRQLAERARRPSRRTCVKEGDKVMVKLLGFDDRGKVRLSMKVVDQETGEEEAPEPRKKKDEDGDD